jgi:hypothetical protein
MIPWSWTPARSAFTSVTNVASDPGSFLLATVMNLERNRLTPPSVSWTGVNGPELSVRKITPPQARVTCGNSRCSIGLYFEQYGG